jgi:hypothetical protein
MAAIIARIEPRQREKYPQRMAAVSGSGNV